jgi:diguanylate cyclase (GGDEF)-like protein
LRRAGYRAQAFTAALTVLLAGAAIYTSSLVFDRQETLRNVSRYNLGWTVSQAVQEVSRLQAAIGAFGVSHGDVEREAVGLWLEIVASRVATLREGSPGAFIRADPESCAIVDELAKAVTTAAPLLQSLDDPGNALQLLHSFQRLNPRMARLASLAHAHGADLSAQDAQELASLHWQFSGLLLGLIACCLTLTGISAWRNRLLARANAEVRSLVEDLTRTGERLSASNLLVQEAMSAIKAQNEVLQSRDAELQRQNELFEAALNNMSQGLGMFDAEHRLIVCNRRFSELFHLPAGLATPGAHAAELLRQAGRSGGFSQAATEAAWEKHQELATRRSAATFIREDEEGRSLWVSHRPLADGGWVATYEDVTESRRAEARIRHLANHDALTGLPNRRQLNQHLQQTLTGSVSGRQDTALLLLDLDHFKNVNDTLGHQAGDELLRSAAARIKACAGEKDLVARLGGDEFAVLVLDKASSHEHLEALATRISEALSAPFALGQYLTSVGASIGIATATGPLTNADTLLKHADVALYRAKTGGRGRYRVFEASMAAELQSRIELEGELRSALERSELKLHYQPLVDLRSGQLSGFEALLRWHHPSRGTIPPAEFIPIAEETGLIVPIGRWVLRQACAEAAASFPDEVKVAVNISPVQFAGDDLPKQVRAALAESGLSPNRLELEITESALLQDSEAVVATLHRLRDMGLRIALDDFGTKYSSLSYLRSFPFDKIKIDQSFVRDMGTRQDCFAIVHSVARLAAQLDMTATAEGVEDSTHLDQVREAGCTEAQGYLFGRPAPSTALGHWFRSKPPMLSAVGNA